MGVHRGPGTVSQGPGEGVRRGRESVSQMTQINLHVFGF